MMKHDPPYTAAMIVPYMWAEPDTAEAWARLAEIEDEHALEWLADGLEALGYDALKAQDSDCMCWDGDGRALCDCGLTPDTCPCIAISRFPPGPPNPEDAPTRWLRKKVNRQGFLDS